VTPALRTEGSALLVSAALIVAVNVVLFATPLYRGLVEPESRAGSFDRALAAADAAATDAPHDVLVLGDSRIYSGFDAARAEREAPGITFINAAVPGTTPRCWDVFDRALDPQAARFRAVVIPVDTYADDDSAIGSVDGDDRYEDLHYIVFAASLSDVGRVSASFPHDDRRIEALFDLLLRGPLLRDDIANLLADPRGRVDALAATRSAPRARDGSLAGLRVDFGRDTLVPPPLFPASQEAELERQVLRTGVASPSYAAYRREWLAPIVRRYRARGVPVIFVRIPTRPLHRVLPAPPSGTIAEFRRDGARILPQASYVALERPELFADADHLNRLGAMRFSALLGADVARELLVPSSHRAIRSPAHVALGGLGTGIASALEVGTPLRFQSFEFAVFFALVTIAYYALRGAVPRRALLLLASWYFYARWNAWYLAVLLGLTATDFMFGLGIERTDGMRRRAMLAAGVAANVAFLAIVKYGDFVTGSVAHVLGLRSNPWERALLVPVGISFHTFQSISYLVDVARGKVRAVRNAFDYALYIAFFPQLLAGPIVRAGLFFGELARRHAAQPEAMARGLHQIVLGLFKKSVIADRFAPVADAYFGSIATHAGAAAAWSGALAFAVQIYFDFSGYSDIAIGCARVLGFDFPENFHRPYLAWSITEFWRRWHMTLSAWLRDYLYIPLGGNRFGRVATYRNLIVTMLIGGLWHGANWTFVAWGGYHGIALALERAVGIGRDRDAPPPRGLRRIAATVATFLVVLIGWVLFRAQTFADAFAALRAMLSFAPGPWLLDVSSLLLAAVALATEIVVERGGWNWPVRTPLARGAGLAGLVLALELGSYPGAAAEFVYFKF
jgi:D-alanyl-lipoteichoic acid acyltransferase DltB (MBOAT superfamily)